MKKLGILISSNALFLNTLNQLSSPGCRYPDIIVGCVALCQCIVTHFLYFDQEFLVWSCRYIIVRRDSRAILNTFLFSGLNYCEWMSEGPGSDPPVTSIAHRLN